MNKSFTPAISIIIPAYKAADYLHISVNSILNQEDFSNFEIIIVEDHSDDGDATLRKACELAASDKRIRVARTEVNSGCGPSRNVGLDIARGEYVTFLDSDDTLRPETLKEIYSLALSNGADVVMFSMEKVLPSGKVKDAVDTGFVTVIDDPMENAELRTNTFHPSVEKKRPSYILHSISRLVRVSMLNDNNIRFPVKKHLLSEDYPFCYDTIRYAKVCVLTTKSYYRYLQRDGSITHDERPDMIERAVASAQYFADIMRRDPDAPSSGVNNAWGYAIVAVRAYTKLMFMSSRSLSYKRQWMRKQAEIPLFRQIYGQYPRRYMPLKHRLGFICFYRKHFTILYAMVVGQEKIRKLLGKI